MFKKTMDSLNSKEADVLGANIAASLATLGVLGALLLITGGVGLIVKFRKKDEA